MTALRACPALLLCAFLAAIAGVGVSVLVEMVQGLQAAF